MLNLPCAPGKQGGHRSPPHTHTTGLCPKKGLLPLQSIASLSLSFKQDSSCPFFTYGRADTQTLNSHSLSYK